jgi:hypothetical protein
MTDDHTHRGDDVHPVELAMRDHDEGMTGWQPIATAPDDGSMVDLWIEVGTVGERATNYYWNKKMRCWRYQHGGDILPNYVTHWMPLPAAPTEGKHLTPSEE